MHIFSIFPCCSSSKQYCKSFRAISINDASQTRWIPLPCCQRTYKLKPRTCNWSRTDGLKLPCSSLLSQGPSLPARWLTHALSHSRLRPSKQANVHSAFCCWGVHQVCQWTTFKSTFVVWKLKSHFVAHPSHLESSTLTVVAVRGVLSKSFVRWGYWVLDRFRDKPSSLVGHAKGMRLS